MQADRSLLKRGHFTCSQQPRPAPSEASYLLGHNVLSSEALNARGGLQAAAELLETTRTDA
jgi:hypothetical protein